ncbi:MAG: DUF2510 domain-containing protein [Candidatus Nanopelagicales bacterium]
MSERAKSSKTRKRQVSEEILANAVVQPDAPGWYPEPGKFGFQRYWDGITYVGPSRLGFGDEAPFDPYLEKGSSRWLMQAAVLGVGGLLLLSPIASLIRGDGGQWTGMLLVGLTPILWLLAFALLVLLARLPAPSAAAAQGVARRGRLVAALALVLPFVVFAIGRLLFVGG